MNVNPYYLDEIQALNGLLDVRVRRDLSVYSIDERSKLSLDRKIQS